MEDQTPIEVYREEYTRLRQESEQLTRFQGLLASISPEKTAVKEAMQSLYSSRSDRLLDPEKLEKLRRQNESLWKEVMLYYEEYQKKELKSEL